jgi:TPR repeat protein
MRYYETAGEFGDGRGYERLADMYRAPTDGTPPQIDRAISLYERAAAIGSADAARKLHALKTQRESYYLRAMTERAASPKDAYRHFVAAADMGYALAAVRIGDCYLGGIGVTADPRRAYLWYARAAKDGVNEAFYPLALCYARGVGTPFNYREALTWLRRAHAIGCAPALEEATRLLGARKKKKERALHACVCELLYQGKGEAALPMAELSASFGDGKAIYTLAAMAEFGIGMPADGARARELYEKAAARGFIDERATYKRILLRQINDAQ